MAGYLLLTKITIVTNLITKDTTTNKNYRNFRTKDNSPLEAKCLVECIIYEATVSTTNETSTYFGSAEGHL